MRRKTIAVDIDDVLAAHVEAFVKFSNEKYGTRLTPEDYTDHWADLWHEDHDEVERRAKEFHVPQSVIQYRLIEEADTALRKLSKDYALVVVTARRQALLKTTKDWLDSYLPGVFKDTHFVPIWVPNNKVTKADICQQIGADYLIDDLPRHCNLAAKAGIATILFGNYSWNRNEKVADGVVRAKDWPEVIEYFYGKN